MKRTPLYEAHAALGGRFVDFAGWEMPVQYTGLIEEHLRVRSSCGLFDVSHMGEIEITGPGALSAVQYLSTNDINKIKDGRCQYTLLCYPEGGVVDDTIVYRFSDERFLYCVNGVNTDKVFEWMLSQDLSDVRLENVSEKYAQIALQGPASVEVLRPLVDKDPASIKGFHFNIITVKGSKAIVSRTGYTGEDGFEIYVEPGSAPNVWNALMEAGRAFGILPIGLGARDTLRLEMGYPLYGHELSRETTPIEAGLKKYVALKKDGFIGKDVFDRQVSTGVQRSLVGFELKGRGVARPDYPVSSGGRVVGRVTSGTMSPSLRRAVGMAYVEPPLNAAGTELDIMIRERPVKAVVVKPPFYKKKAVKAAV